MLDCLGIRHPVVFVTLTVTDDEGADHTATQSVTVPTAGNSSPTADFSNDCSDLTCNYNGSTSSDSDGSIASYAWNFGDSGTASEATPSHTYASAGTYTVTLTVTDSSGATNSTTQSVTVTAAGNDSAEGSDDGGSSSGGGGSFSIVLLMLLVGCRRNGIN